MTAIAWTRLSGDDIEQMVAVMLLRKHPIGRHVKANPGDGGIDVFIPDGPGLRTGVNYQIKKFSEKITSTQQAQIRKSLKAAQTTTDEGYFVIRECFITCPLLPTSADYKWLSRTSTGLTFDTDWYGLSHIEGLVAEFPDVVDYYQNNRAEYFSRIIENAYDFAREALRINGKGEIAPHELVSHLAQLQRIANQDPLYSYDFATMSSRPDSDALLVSSKPGLVATTIQQIDDDLYVSVDLSAKFPDAVNIRPCTITVRSSRQNEADESYDDFLQFGTAAELIADVNLDLPGGLGGEFSKVNLKIGPSRPTSARTYKYEVVDSQGDVLSELLIEHGIQGVGALRTGAHIRGTDFQNIVGVEWRFDRSGENSSLAFSCESFEGRPLLEVYQSFMFLASLSRGVMLRLTDTLIPRRVIRHPLEGFDRSNQWTVAEPLMQNLRKIQQVVDVPVLIPDLLEIGKEGVESIIVAGRLLDGETIVGTWNKIETILPNADNIVSTPQPVVLRAPHEVKLGDQSYAIGTVEAIHDSAVGEIIETETDFVVRFTPSGSNSMSIRLIAELD
ncbi:hypothetical protein LCL61_17610 [Amycolatopsis coloradensis]|uniref:Uncharacterized protein n=1 Tax=Amycolatopsis coloradensis TaxID=76021 RepID=A0ACD5BDK3_9PSEU